jgi:iron(III) transport system substrate-binding protein
MRGPALALLLALLAAPAAAQVTEFPARQPGGPTLAIHAATDIVAMEPLVRDFQAVAPQVRIVYREYITTDLFRRMREDCATGRTEVDLVLSSSADQIVALVNDGCAERHRSAETARLPDWARWRDEVWGFTFEPAAIVVHRDLLPAEARPTDRFALIALLRSRPEAFRGRIGTYDIEQSGIGFLFAAHDARQSSLFGRLAEAFGRADLVTRCCSADLLDALAEGRLLVGYNILASYAVGMRRRGAPIEIILPHDGTIVLSRAAMIPRSAPNAGTAKRFVDHLVSERGQALARSDSFFFGMDGSLPPEVVAPADMAASGLMRPIAIGPSLLAEQDRARRQRFLDEWRRSMAPRTAD